MPSPKALDSHSCCIHMGKAGKHQKAATDPLPPSLSTLQKPGINKESINSTYNVTTVTHGLAPSVQQLHGEFLCQIFYLKKALKQVFKVTKSWQGAEFSTATPAPVQHPGFGHLKDSKGHWIGNRSK